MKVVTLKELKNRLSAYLRHVKNGEVVLVTDRGKVVAELRQPRVDRPPSTLDDALERLHAKGVLALASVPQDPRVYRPSPLRRAVRSADMLDAEREDR